MRRASRPDDRENSEASQQQQQRESSWKYMEKDGIISNSSGGEIEMEKMKNDIHEDQGEFELSEKARRILQGFLKKVDLEKILQDEIIGHTRQTNA